MERDNENNMKGSQFGLPDGYFHHSGSRIMQRLEWQEEHRPYPTLLKLRDAQPFIVPDNYFNASLGRLELLDQPTLGSLPRTVPFTVPDGYFEKPVQPERKTARIITIRRTVTMAMAACLMLFLGIWGYRQYSVRQVEDCGTVACLNRSDVLKSKQVEMLDEEDLYDAVSVDKLESALNGDNAPAHDSSAHPSSPITQ